MKTDARQGNFLNIIVGVFDTLIGGFVFQFLGLSASNINSGDFSLWSLFVSFFGAIILLGVFNLFRCESVR